MGTSSKVNVELTIFFPMFPFDPPENIRKPKVSESRESKGNIREKRVNVELTNRKYQVPQISFAD